MTANAARQLHIIREVSWQEVLELVNLEERLPLVFATAVIATAVIRQR